MKKTISIPLGSTPLTPKERYKEWGVNRRKNPFSDPECWGTLSKKQKFSIFINLVVIGDNHDQIDYELLPLGIFGNFYKSCNSDESLLEEHEINELIRTQRNTVFSFLKHLFQKSGHPHLLSLIGSDFRQNEAFFKSVVMHNDFEVIRTIPDTQIKDKCLHYQYLIELCQFDNHDWILPALKDVLNHWPERKYPELKNTIADSFPELHEWKIISRKERKTHEEEGYSAKRRTPYERSGTRPNTNHQWEPKLEGRSNADNWRNKPIQGNFIPPQFDQRFLQNRYTLANFQFNSVNRHSNPRQPHFFETEFPRLEKSTRQTQSKPSVETHSPAFTAPSKPQSPIDPWQNVPYIDSRYAPGGRLYTKIPPKVSNPIDRHTETPDATAKPAVLGKARTKNTEAQATQPQTDAITQTEKTQTDAITQTSTTEPTLKAFLFDNQTNGWRPIQNWSELPTGTLLTLNHSERHGDRDIPYFSVMPTPEPQIPVIDPRVALIPPRLVGRIVFPSMVAVIPPPFQ